MKVLLKVLKNILWFFSIAFFGGVLWLIWCDILLTYYNPDRDPERSFLLTYNLEYLNPEFDRSEIEVVITIMYFMMTTMSTVGFGDMFP